MPQARQRVRFALPGLASLAFALAVITAVAPLGPLAPAGAAVSGPATVRADDEATPLSVEIDSITPGSIPDRGAVTVTGTVTNNDTVVWSDVGIYPFIGLTPLTNQGEVDTAMALSTESEVGQRILTPGDYTQVASLAPGQTVSYRIQVPRKHLNDYGVRDPGVYWFGVHALGSGPEGMDSRADGRARTFLPLIAPNSTAVTTTVVVPIRAAVAYAADGSLTNLSRWATLLRPGGRLARLADLARSPGAGDVSWLVDPAVLAAVRRLAAGNPGRPLTTDTTPPSATPSPSPTLEAPTASGAASSVQQPAAVSGVSARSAAEVGSARSSAVKTAGDTAELAAELTPLATAWWETVSAALTSVDVLALPYGDLDLAGAAAHDPDSYTAARELSASTFESWGVTATPVNAPSGGTLDAATVRMLADKDPSAPVLISDQVLPPETETVLARVDGLTLIAVDSGASAGGPAPTESLGGTALRQRVLAEAAVRSLNPTTGPLVVELPAHWSVADQSQLALGLSQTWLRPTGLVTGIQGQPSTALDSTRLDLTGPATSRSKAISEGTFEAAEGLIRAGQTLQRVLTGNEKIAPATRAEALTNLSYQRRGSSTVPAAISTIAIETLLDRIGIQAPPSVILSGSSGRFAATVTNPLDVPVTVALTSVTDAGISLSSPDPVSIAAGGSATLLMQANDATVGVHDVRLSLSDTSGDRFGTSVAVPVRASQVAKIIWVFLAVGCGLLFGAIGSRLFRRLRRTRREVAR